MRSFYPLLSVNPLAIVAMVEIAASNMSNKHALGVHYGIFPATGIAYYRVADRLLFEQREHRGEAEKRWYVDFAALEYVMPEVCCPLRMLAYTTTDGERHFRLLIPPDPARPRATRWRILCTGVLCNDLLERCRGVFKETARDASWSQAMVSLYTPIIFAGERT
jgi:hypothetical protein